MHSYWKWLKKCPKIVISTDEQMTQSTGKETLRSQVSKDHIGFIGYLKIKRILNSSILFQKGAEKALE